LKNLTTQAMSVTDSEVPLSGYLRMMFLSMCAASTLTAVLSNSYSKWYFIGGKNCNKIFTVQTDHLFHDYGTKRMSSLHDNSLSHTDHASYIPTWFHGRQNNEHMSSTSLAHQSIISVMNSERTTKLHMVQAINLRFNAYSV
jgi:hypothetical protein